MLATVKYSRTSSAERNRSPLSKPVASWMRSRVQTISDPSCCFPRSPSPVLSVCAPHHGQVAASWALPVRNRNLSPTRHIWNAISRIPRGTVNSGGSVVSGYPQHLIRRPNIDSVTIGGPKSSVIGIVEQRASFLPGENAPQLVTRNLLVFPLIERIVVVD